MIDCRCRLSELWPKVTPLQQVQEEMRCEWRYLCFLWTHEWRWTWKWRQKKMGRFLFLAAVDSPWLRSFVSGPTFSRGRSCVYNLGLLCTWSLTVVHIDPLQLQVTVALVTARRVDAVLVAYYLPELEDNSLVQVSHFPFLEVSQDFCPHSSNVL